MTRLTALREQYAFIPAAPEQVVAVLPADSGAALLTRLARGSSRERADLVGDLNRIGGSGGQFGRFVELGSNFLKANVRRRFPSLDLALAAEAAAEELRAELGIYHPERLWFVSRGADDQFWVCSLTPRLPLLRERFNQRLDRSSWLMYLAALRGAFELALEREVVLDCNPNNFGESGGRLFYVDDDLVRNAAGASLTLQALLRLREYPQARPEDRAEFVHALCQLCSEYGRSPKLGAGILADLGNELLWPAEAPLRDRLSRLTAALGSTRRRKKP